MFINISCDVSLQDQRAEDHVTQPHDAAALTEKVDGGVDCVVSAKVLEKFDLDT